MTLLLTQSSFSYTQQRFIWLYKFDFFFRRVQEQFDKGIICYELYWNFENTIRHHIVLFVYFFPMFWTWIKPIRNIPEKQIEYNNFWCGCVTTCKLRNIIIISYETCTNPQSPVNCGTEIRRNFRIGSSS